MKSTLGLTATAKIVEHIAIYRRNLDVATLRSDLPVDDVLNNVLSPELIRSSFTKAGLPVAGNKLATSVEASL
jgi:hypothetical protein